MMSKPHNRSQNSTNNGVRLDQWLWAARFYKQRPLAVNAIKNHRVTINGQRAKPARMIHIGDTITIEKQSDLVFSVVVEVLHNKRVSAAIAQTFYRETPESIANREKLRRQQELARALVSFSQKKPDKRERRQIRAIRHDPFKSE